MALLGKNKRGEDVHSSAEGGRYVMKDGKVMGELFTQPAYNPYNLLSDDRYRTVMEAVEAVRRLFTSGIDGIGTSAAVAAMMPYWETHFAEGHGAEIVVRDLEEVRRSISALLDNLKATLDLPDDGN
jgi:hypothetical protein